MARFLYNRSCNDDYIPQERINIINPTMLETNIYLENIDNKLEQLYKETEPKINEEDETTREAFDEYEQEIIDYANRNNISIADAVDYLKTCHHCGNPDIPFASEYCNERCQDYSIDFCYPCYREADCKVCDNWYRHRPFDHSENNTDPAYRVAEGAEIGAEIGAKIGAENINKTNYWDETYEEKITRIKAQNPKNDHETDVDYHYRIMDLSEEEFKASLDDLPRLTYEEYCQMEQYYSNNDDDDENVATTTSHCSLCDSYVYKTGKHCNSCIAYHGKNEFTNYIEFRCYDDNGNYLYDDDENNDSKNNIWDIEQERNDAYEEEILRLAEEAEQEDEENGW
jgi:hypothetical protein